MTKKEKVIKGLEICSELGSWHGLDCKLNEAYKDCPYRGCETGCVVTIAKDAIILLKEQEQEINFLKAMQLQTIKGMDENELGNIVGKTLGLLREEEMKGMKVKDVVNRINDIECLRDYLEDWAAGKINDPDRIAAITDEIDVHLSAYTKLLANKKVKWK